VAPNLAIESRVPHIIVSRCIKAALSMDWFEGQFTGSPIFHGKIYG